MSARVDDLLEALFTTTPIGVPRFVALCSCCGDARLEVTAPAACAACDADEPPALARVEVLEPRP